MKSDFPVYSCQECPTPCFDFEETGVCPREAELFPAVCPMFEDFPIDGISDNIATRETIPP